MKMRFAIFLFLALFGTINLAVAGESSLILDVPLAIGPSVAPVPPAVQLLY